jgi:uncharacterized damage-inducible protein DinB
MELEKERRMDNPYAKDLGGLDALAVLEETPARIERAASRLDAAGFARSYAPGKWTTHQLVNHLLHAEIVVVSRIRFALTTPGYVVQPFEQDDWVAREPLADPRAAVAALCAQRRWNLALFRSLTPEERRRTFTHPDSGIQNVWLLVEMMAGHDRHHLPQLETIAEVGRAT